jgi:hypothetical protein
MGFRGLKNRPLTALAVLLHISKLTNRGNRDSDLEKQYDRNEELKQQTPSKYSIQLLRIQA